METEDYLGKINVIVQNITCIQEMSKIVCIQKILVQAAAITPNSQLVAKHIEEETGIFDKDDYKNMKELCEVEG